MSPLRLGLGVGVLCAFWGLGTLLGGALGLPLPGSVVGLVLLWAALELGAVNLDWVRHGGTTLLDWLGLLFVPAGVGWIQFASQGANWAGALAIVVVGSVVAIGLVGMLLRRALPAEEPGA